jgi:NitT/TauT family transport system ATP-binding protein
MTIGVQETAGGILSPAVAPTVAIRACSLDVGYPSAIGTKIVLQNLNLTIAEGAFVTILGPSGCGKSTLLRVIADLLKPASGSIEVLGGAPEVARRRRDVAFVFQDATLLPWRTVIGNVRLPLDVGRASITRPISSSPDDLLELVGLREQRYAYPHELSGGQRQRVAIARALLCQPRVMLMDEPFGALDEINRDRLNDELLAVWKTTGTTIMFVTHSISEAVYLGQRVVVLATNPGQLREVLDIGHLKDERGGSDREAREFTAAMAHLRSVLKTC